MKKQKITITVLASLLLVAYSFASQDTSPVSGALAKNKELQKTLFACNGNNVLGNKNAEVVIIDFFDYNCSDCRAIAPFLDELSSTDKNVKVVYFDYPKLGSMSVYSAKVAIAAMQVNKYKEVHHALIFSKVKLTSQKQILDIVKNTGIDIKTFEKTINNSAVNDFLLNTMLTGVEMRLVYVPTLVIGYSKSPYKPTVLAEPTPQEIKNVLQKYLKIKK